MNPAIDSMETLHAGMYPYGSFRSTTLHSVRLSRLQSRSVPLQHPARAPPWPSRRPQWGEGERHSRETGGDGKKLQKLSRARRRICRNRGRRIEEGVERRVRIDPKGCQRRTAGTPDSARVAGPLDRRPVRGHVRSVESAIGGAGGPLRFTLRTGLSFRLRFGGRCFGPTLPQGHGSGSDHDPLLPGVSPHPAVARSAAW